MFLLFFYYNSQISQSTNSHDESSFLRQQMSPGWLGNIPGSSSTAKQWTLLSREISKKKTRDLKMGTSRIGNFSLISPQLKLSVAFYLLESAVPKSPLQLWDFEKCARHPKVSMETQGESHSANDHSFHGDDGMRSRDVGEAQELGLIWFVSHPRIVQ